MTHNLSFLNTLTSKFNLKFRKYGLMLFWPRTVKEATTGYGEQQQQKQKQSSRGRAMNYEVSGKVRFYLIHK
jgi:hypothetical protein